METPINQEPALPPDLQPQKSHVGFYVALAVIVTAIIVGGGVYAWQRSETAKMQLELQKQIQELQRGKPASYNQLPDSTSNAIPANIPTSTSTSSIPQQQDLKTYSNPTLGIFFQYPSSWQAPQQSSNLAGDGGYEPGNAIWKLATGENIPNGCEVGNCRTFIITGYPYKTPEIVLNEIKSNEDNTVEKETSINGSRTYIYSSAGICGYKNALLFTTNKIVEVTGRCAKDDQNTEQQFDALLNTIKL